MNWHVIWWTNSLTWYLYKNVSRVHYFSGHSYSHVSWFTWHEHLFMFHSFCEYEQVCIYRNRCICSFSSYELHRISVLSCLVWKFAVLYRLDATVKSNKYSVLSSKYFVEKWNYIIAFLHIALNVLLNWNLQLCVCALKIMRTALGHPQWYKLVISSEPTSPIVLAFSNVS